MTTYPTLRNALEMFSVQLGLEDSEAKEMLRRSLKQREWREALEGELRDAVADPDAPWCELVANDDYELDEPESANEARSIVLGAVWEEVFPGTLFPRE